MFYPIEIPCYLGEGGEMEAGMDGDCFHIHPPLQLLVTATSRQWWVHRDSPVLPFWADPSWWPFLVGSRMKVLGAVPAWAAPIIALMSVFV